MVNSVQRKEETLSFDVEQTTILAATLSFNIPQEQKREYGELFKKIAEVVAEEGFDALSSEFLEVGKKLAGRGRPPGKPKKTPKKKAAKSSAKKKTKKESPVEAPEKKATRRIKITAEEAENVADEVVEDEDVEIVHVSDSDVESDEYDEFAN